MDKKTNRYILLLLGWGLTVGGICATHAAAHRVAAENGDEQLQQILAMAYVDIRVGFSVRPPFGCEISRRIGVKPSSLETSPNEPGGIADWELLKYPESKILVKFADQNGRQIFTVYQLVTKQRKDIETMVSERRNYWQKFPHQATLQNSRTDTINNRPAAFLTLGGQNEPTEPNQMIIREGLVEQERDRYFLLSLVKLNHPDHQNRQDELLMDSVMRNFVCMSRQEQRLRWEQGRKRAELFLAGLQFDQLEQALENEVWFRLLKEGRDIGFLQMKGQKTGGITTAVQEQQMPGKAEAELVLEITGFVNNPTDAVRLARMLECERNLTNGNGDSESAIKHLTDQMTQANTVDIKIKYRLSEGLKQEFFETHCRAAPDQGYRETGQWREVMLQADRFDDPKNPNQSMTETQDVNPRLYLPGVTKFLMGRLWEGEIGQEFVFLRYSNRAIRYFVVRLAGRCDIEVEVIGKTETGEQQITREKIPCLYVVSQAGAEGPIVETWLDQNGKTLKQQFDGLTLLQTTGETIKNLWPGRVITNIERLPSGNN